MTAHVWLIGESNPYQSEPAPEYDLFPSPPQSAGARLAKILGYEPDAYVDTFKRHNLLYGQKWSVVEARKAAKALLAEAGDRDAFVLLGAKVAAAFGMLFVPMGYAALTREGRPAVMVLRIPHPSGLCRLWGQPGMRDKVREAVGEMVRQRQTRVWLKCEDDGPAFDQRTFEIVLDREDDLNWYGRMSVSAMAGEITWPKHAWKVVQAPTSTEVA